MSTDLTPGRIDPVYRSLLQKAARRGHVNLVLTLSAYIRSLGPVAKRWYTQQAALSMFRSCWPLGVTCRFTRKFAGKVAVLVNTTRMVKNQDAAGLGAMAYALAGGDPSVLNKGRPGPEQGHDQNRIWEPGKDRSNAPDRSDDADPGQNRHIKLLASAIKRPKDFWEWIDTQDTQGRTRAVRRFKNIGRPFDRAVVQAAAYLMVSSDSPEIFGVPPMDDKFPYWVAFDHHVGPGREALAQISRDLRLPAGQLKWLLFYFEGARTQKRLPSPWWDRYCTWHLNRFNLVPEQARLIWSSARPQLVDALTEDANRLHKEVYRWKIAHLDQIEALREEVEATFSPFDRIQTRQQSLF